jgi:hypothetical protein
MPATLGAAGRDKKAIIHITRYTDLGAAQRTLEKMRKKNRKVGDPAPTKAEVADATAAYHELVKISQQDVLMPRDTRMWAKTHGSSVISSPLRAACAMSRKIVAVPDVCFFRRFAPCPSCLPVVFSASSPAAFRPGFRSVLVPRATSSFPPDVCLVSIPRQWASGAQHVQPRTITPGES